MTPRIMTALEAAHVLRISLDQVHRNIAEGNLVPVGVTLGGKSYYREAAPVPLRISQCWETMTAGAPDGLRTVYCYLPRDHALPHRCDCEDEPGPDDELFRE